jgi:hypothetical protein
VEIAVAVFDAVDLPCVAEELEVLAEPQRAVVQADLVRTIFLLQNDLIERRHGFLSSRPGAVAERVKA